MNLLIYIAIIHAYIAYKLWWDHRVRTREKRVINHKASGVINILLYAGSAYFLLVPVYGWLRSGIILGISFIWKGLAFDIAYNRLFNSKWSYCGDNSIVDNIYDNIDGKDDNDCTLGVFVKVLLIVTGVVSIIVI